ncbi:MAG: sialate O-acetylesterase [Oscillospiraceae bacterium]|nr:sialate O-acetylesterase [Oscillospiraceae bacterium]
MRAAAVFSDRMVLQREKPVTVWGDAEEGCEITVTLCGNRASAAVKSGKWRVTLPPMQAAEHQRMVISDGTEQIVFRDIAIGEVWLCGGQSNMEFEIRNEKNGAALLQSLTPECGVRYYYTPKLSIMDAQSEAAERNTCWQTASEENAGAWSAVGLYFALEIAQKLHVTVGLIGCNWGGTSASAWVSRDVLEQHTALQPYLEDYQNAVAGKSSEELIAAYDRYVTAQNQWYEKYNLLMQAHPDTSWEDAQKILGASQYPGPMGPKNECRPCGLYETMLQRICPYTLRGFLFYQGESDDHRPETYEILLKALISCWRRDWGEPDLPFMNVQLPMFCYAGQAHLQNWSRIREAQMRVFQQVRNTGLAVIADSAEIDNIHPIEKSAVGKRLALQALCHVYGEAKPQEACAPMFRYCYARANEMVCAIQYADEGFQVQGEADGFFLAGADGVFYPAKAVCQPNQIVLTSDPVPYPKSVRYGWCNYMKVNVFGANGLPLIPFRFECDAVHQE